MIKLFNIKIDGKIDGIFYEELLESIKIKQFENYAKYLFGKSFGKKINKNRSKLLVLSWFENQTIHKLLFLGIRESECVNHIIGTQYFNNPRSMYHFYLDESEFNKQIVPDEILVKGAYYMEHDNQIKYRMGHAPREMYLKNIILEKESLLNRINLSVMLTYTISESNNILNVMNRYTSDNKIFIKLHPNHRLNNPFHLNDKYQLIDDENSKIFKNSALVVTGNSGVALEALVYGCSVLIILDDNDLPQHPIPEDIGKNIIWNVAYSVDNINLGIQQLLINRERNIEQIQELAEWYKENMFNYEFNCYRELGINNDK